MSPELVAAAVLFGPAAVIGPVCIAGHLRVRRRDAAEAAVCAAFRPMTADAPEPPPKGRMKGKPEAAPARLATVIDFPTHRRTAA